jgi:hypothetical protein
MSNHAFPDPFLKSRPTEAARQAATRILAGPHRLPGEGGEITYADISGSVQLTDDPGGTFHQVMYDLHMGGATPPPEPGRGTADRPAPAETNLRPARVRRRDRVVPRLRSTGHVDQSGAPTQLPCPAKTTYRPFGGQAARECGDPGQVVEDGGSLSVLQHS